MVFVALLFVIMALVPARNIQIGYDLLVTLLVFPLLVFWGACSIPGKFAGRVFTWLGGISYGVYVLQQAYYTIVMATTAAVTGHDFAGLSPGGLVIALLLLLPLATLAHSCFDLPVRQRLTKFLNMKRPLKLPAGNAA
jgi:peptidoglycan/LPS O-acetylase OafA/YrhL